MHVYRSLAPVQEASTRVDYCIQTSLHYTLYLRSLHSLASTPFISASPRKMCGNKNRVACNSCGSLSRCHARFCTTRQRCYSCCRRGSCHKRSCATRSATPVLDHPMTQLATHNNYNTVHHERNNQLDGGYQASIPPENPPAYDAIAPTTGAQHTRSLLGALLNQLREIGQPSQVDEKNLLQAYGAGWKDAHGH